MALCDRRLPDEPLSTVVKLDHTNGLLSVDGERRPYCVAQTVDVEINTARFILDRDPVSVTAQMSSPSEEFADVPAEFASFTLDLEGDLPLLCTTSQNAQSDTQLKLISTKGQIELAPAFHGEATLPLSKREIRAEADAVDFTEIEEMREEFDYFADRVLSDEEIVPDGRHALTDMYTIRAIHESVEIRRDRGDLARSISRTTA